MKNFPTILHALASHAKAIPDKVAVIEARAACPCTFGELWAYVKAFSKRLATAGVVRNCGDSYGTRVVVRCSQTIDYMVASLAVQLAGGVFVPVEKNIADERIIEIMQETGSEVLIAAKPLPNYNCAYIPLADATSEADAATDGHVAFPEPDALAEILFTTGTTGKSRGVMASHRVLAAIVRNIRSRYEHNGNQIWLIPNPLSHANGLRRAYCSLFSACTLVFIDGYAMANDFFSAIEKYNVTCLTLLSAATELYLRKYRDNLKIISSRIDCLALSGSVYTPEQISALRDIFAQSKIIQTYGSTEIPGCVLDHSQKVYPPFCIGQPPAGTGIAFFNEEKTERVVATRENPGLIGIKSEAGMLGYWKDPELTASVTRDGFIVLSDYGYRGDDELYYFISRADDVIISGAIKISPVEIEAVANSFGGIRESACVPVDDPIMGQLPKLYVVMEEGYTFSASDIYDYLVSKLETSKVPHYVEAIDSLPRISQKIDRKALRNKR